MLSHPTLSEHVLTRRLYFQPGQCDELRVDGTQEPALHHVAHTLVSFPLKTIRLVLNRSTSQNRNNARNIDY